MQRLTTQLIADIAPMPVVIFPKGYKHIVAVLFDLLLNHKKTIDSLP